MEEGAKGGSGSSGLETLVLEKVGEVSSAIDAAKHVDEVICALYSLAVRIFPVDYSALCGSISDPSRLFLLEWVFLSYFFCRSVTYLLNDRWICTEKEKKYLGAYDWERHLNFLTCLKIYLFS